MRTQGAILVGLFTFFTLLTLFTAAPAVADTHPRIWLTPAVLSALRAKAAANDGDWIRVKGSADQLLAQPMPRFTVTAGSNGNPVQFTIAETIPWSGSTPIYIGGGSGGWSAVNTAGDRPSAIQATRTGANTFTIPIDASGFGSFAGQRLALFFAEGGYSGYGYEGLDWQSTFETLGIAYQVTGNAAYAAKGLQLLDYIASLGVAGMLAPEAIDSGFPSRSAIYGLAIGYDWFYDRLTASEKAAVAQTVNLWYDWFKRAGFENGGPAYGNYFGGHVLGFGLAGFATEADNSRGSEISAFIGGLFRTQAAAAFSTGGFAGGYALEVYTYGANHFQRLLYYMLAVRTATGEDLIASTGYAQKIARNLLYNLKPNGWQVTDEGDYAGDYTGVLQPSLPIVLSSVLAGTDEGKWMQQLQQNLSSPPHGGQTIDPFVRFVFGDASRPAADYRLTLPTWFHSPGDEHFYRRSSWQADAVWTSMAGGAANWAGHQMRSAGHVAIQRGNDYLLVNSGQWKGPTGDFGMPQAFDLRSWRANTLFVDDGGDYLFTGTDYVGGQGYWGASSVLASDGGADFGYMKADLTTAYSIGDRKPWDSRSVRIFHRNFLSVGNGVVILFDRMQFQKASYVKKLYFHLNPGGGPPAIAGDTASIRVGDSALFVRTLLPASPLLAAAPDPVSDSDSRPITYRLEVSDSSAGTTFNALNILVATAGSTGSMPATTRLQSNEGTMVGAMVADGGSQRIGLFSLNGTPQSSVTYTADYAATQAGVHVIADLTPNAPFTITRNGVTIATAQSSSAGVVTFRSPGGGLFAVRNQTATTAPQAPTNVRIIGADTSPGGDPGGNPSSQGGRFVAMVSPTPGERFTAPSTLRLVAVGHDPNVNINEPTTGHGGNAAAVQFFVDFSMVLEVDQSQAEYYVFKGFAANVAAGSHRVWARAIYSNPALVLDSGAVTVTVSAAPAYARTIDLSSDLIVSGDYQLAGGGGNGTGRIRVNGNGHRIVSAGGGAGVVTFSNVDFFDVGDRAATENPGFDVTVGGGLTVEGCTFDGSNTVRFTINGSSPASIRSNTFRSNMRQPLGQYPDGYTGAANGSFPVLILTGSSIAPKVFQANTVGAGWISIELTQNWLAGGDTAADGNVLIGPRVGIYVDRSTNVQIRRNYSHHVYFGGWSQGSNFELGGASSVLVEHNVIVGSSWPVRGVGGEFRYNLVLGAGHEWLWADHDGAYVHHNVFAGGDNDVGGVYVLYGVRNIRIDNNTFDGMDGPLAATAINVAEGNVSLRSNLFFRMPKTPVTFATGSLNADYNLTWASAAPTYSDSRSPAHDLRADPQLSSPASAIPGVDKAAIWNRTVTVAGVLAQYRAKYSPAAGSPALTGGDPALGAGNQVGAIGRGVNATDLFGR